MSRVRLHSLADLKAANFKLDDATNPRVPHDIKHTAINTWAISFSIHDYWFDRYYILHWQGTYLFDQVNQGTIKHDGIQYRINWITVPTLCYKADQVMLSFRRIFGQAEGYVLIKVKGD